MLLVAVYVLKDKAVEQWYLWQLDSEDEEERQVAAARLGEMGSVKAIPGLMELWPEEGELDAALRASDEYMCIVDALVNIGEPAVPALIKKLDHGDELVRENAVSTLARIRPVAKDAAPALIEILTRENRRKDLHCPSTHRTPYKTAWRDRWRRHYGGGIFHSFGPTRGHSRNWQASCFAADRTPPG